MSPNILMCFTTVDIFISNKFNFKKRTTLFYRVNYVKDIFYVNTFLIYIVYKNLVIFVSGIGCKKFGIMQLSSILYFPLSRTGLTPFSGAKP